MPTVTAETLPDDWTCPGAADVPSTDRDAHVYLVLDLAAGTFTTLIHRRGESYDTLPGGHTGWPKLPAPDGRTASFSFLTVPTRMSWITRLHTAEQLNALLDRLAPLANTIATETIPVPGTDDRDWTVAAAEAADELRFLAEYPDGVPVANKDGVSLTEQAIASRRRYVDAATVYAARPDLANPTWADMDDPALNSEAEMQARFLLHHNPELYTALDLPLSREGTPSGVTLLGTRAWLYGFRQAQAGALTVQSAAGWFARAGRAARITADLSDEQMTALAAAEEEAAGDEGLRLVGAADWIRRTRAEERDAVRQQLGAAGKQTAEAKAAYESQQKRRAALLARILAWEVSTDTDTRLAELAQMSRPGVAKFRDRLTELEDAGADTE